jgi:hypothetical protein
MTLRLRLTPTQAREVEHGMSIDKDMQRPVWGAVTHTGKTSAWLVIYSLPAALYRITSSRDIWQDNASGWGGTPEDRAVARSLEGLVDKIVSLAGGREAVLALPAEPWGGPEDSEEDATISGADLKRYL